MSFTNAEKIQGMEKLLELEPDDPTGWFLLGRLYMDAERFADAERAFRRSVDQKPDYSAAWRQLGDALRKAEKYEEAIAAYQQGLAVAEANRDLQTVKEIRVFLRKLTAE
jgi:cytochrome c-type biogenesis protein CcmH/NrfG